MQIRGFRTAEGIEIRDSALDAPLLRHLWSFIQIIHI